MDSSPTQLLSDLSCSAPYIGFSIVDPNAKNGSKTSSVDQTINDIIRSMLAFGAKIVIIGKGFELGFKRSTVADTADVVTNSYFSSRHLFVKNEGGKKRKEERKKKRN